MRLVIDGQRLTAGRTGVGRCLESLLAEWAESGLPLKETVVVLRDPSGLDRIPRVPGLTAKVVGSNWPGIIWECFGLARELRRDDLLFAPANLTPLPWRGKTVLVIYDTLPWVVPESFPWHVRLRFGWRYRAAARQASRVLVPSQSTANDVITVHGIAPTTIRVIYPCPEPEFRPLPMDSPEIELAHRSVGLDRAPFFLFVGKRSRRRNIPAILDGFAAHLRSNPSHRLVFVGPEDGESLPGPDQGVIRAGHVSEAVLRGLLASTVALLYPSDYEGFGLPVVEALASACPVITLRTSALTEAGGEAPWYLEAPTADAIARALSVLSHDSTVRAHHITLGLEHVAQFSRSRYASEVKAELIEAAGSVSSPQPTA